MGVGDSLARWVYNNQPVKFAAIELVPETAERRARDAARPPQRRRHGHRRDPDPRAGLVAVGPRRRARAPWSRASTPCPPTSSPTDSPRSTPSTWPGTSWSGSARCCSCSSLWYGLCWLFRRDMPKSRWFLRIAVGRRRRRRHHHGGRLGGQRGRPPAVDRLQPHEGRGRRHRQHRGVDHVRRSSPCSTSGSASPRS